MLKNLIGGLIRFVKQPDLTREYARYLEIEFHIPYDEAMRIASYEDVGLYVDNLKRGH